MQRTTAIAIIVATASQIVALPSISKAAEGCAAYPYGEGMNLEDAEGGTKIIATAEVTVAFDDIDSIKDARDEATMSAKAIIAAFLNEGIKKEDTINKAIQATKSMQGEQKSQTRTETLNKVVSLSSSSQGLLRGVVPLGDCYDKGRVLRVSVGIKPESIAAAGNLAGSISKSLSTSPTPTGASSGSNSQPAAASSGTQRPQTPGQPLQGVDSFSNSDRLKKF